VKEMKLLKKVMIIVAAIAIAFTISACEPDEKIVIGEGNWQSNAFHSQVARIIIEEGYGVEVDVVLADTAIMVSSLKADDMDLAMEIWSDNIPTYQDDLDAGEYVELSTNFDDNTQGLYIPTYVAEQNPGLRTVEDLKDYVHLFPNPEGGDKGIIYGGPEGWSATVMLHDKMEAYGLDEYYVFKTINSTPTMNATLASAIANEEPWVGYNWEPTWVTGFYDLTLLEDTEYSPEDFAEGVGAFPSVDVNVVVNSDFEDRFPEITEFLSNYETNSELTSEALAYMEENDAEADAAAVWFMLANEDLWSPWVTDEAYDSIMEYLNAQ
jgi:glycine betaine/proline transport system substrate-binding protein